MDERRRQVFVLHATAGNVFANENSQGEALLKLIPVLDLRGGLVVHARRGKRSAYRPVKTCLCRGSHPLDLCRGLLRLYAFTTIYIADIDSIEGTGVNDDTITELHTAFPHVEFWVDAGLSSDVARDWLQCHEGCFVLGSESQIQTEDVTEFAVGEKEGEIDRVILSLDFGAEAFLGPRELFSETRSWPQRVIVMTLARVGAREGPDYGRLAHIVSRAGDREVIAAGGVRDGDDLNRLRDMGVAGVLLASALFDGRIGEAEITDFCGEQRQG